jgi:two-component system response regulator RegA
MNTETSGHLLLLVEDHNATRNVLARLLSMKGFDVRMASTVAEGVERLDCRPDYLVLDLMLPDGDGEELLRRVRESALRTRVVVTTGLQDDARLAELRKLRPYAVLGKPVGVSDVCRACESAGGLATIGS